VSAADERLLERALAAARASGEPQLAIAGRALSREEAARDPILAFASAPPDGERFFLERPRAGAALVAVGACAEIATDGAQRLERAGALLRELAPRTHASEGAAARWAGGFAFAPEAPRADGAWRAFPSCRFVLPRAWLARAAGGGELGAAVCVAPADELPALIALLARARAEAESLAEAASIPPAARCESASTSLRLVRPARGYRRRVAEALDAIAKGDAEKLVVARAIDCRGAPPPLAATLRALRDAHPRCASFAIAPQRGTAFLGATPELLVRVVRGAVEAQALAGSARRGETALLASAKERSEHALVVDSIQDALGPLCDTLCAPAAPRALELGEIQHLETPVRGRLAAGVRAGALELAARLHPSPAIAGTPREAALGWLAQHEALERGWYAGGIGVLGADGDGELHVALRCALLHEGGARLYAGAGIVTGSRPAAEERETRLKLRAVLRALREASRARG
jgi:isochorismate synthase